MSILSKANESRSQSLLKITIVAVSLATSGALLIANIALLRRNRELQNTVYNQAMIEAPQEGSRLSALKGVDDHGRPEFIDLTSLTRPALVVVLSPGCHYCRVEISTWNRIFAIEKPARVVLVNISGQDDSTLISLLRPPSNAIHINIDRSEAERHYFQVTPTILVVNSLGVIEWAWPGTMPRDKVADLLRMLNKT